MGDMKKQPVLCEVCEKKPSVVGMNGVWVCLRCFDAALGASMLKARKIASLLAEGSDA
jgi:ribosomal protein L37AE/L43A